MTYGPQWWPPQPPPPPPPPRRFSTGWIWAGGGVGLVSTIGIPFLGLALANVFDHGAFTSASGLAAFAPLVLGIVLTSMQGSAARRGFGLGLLIGWGLAPIIFAGVCILVIFGLYTVPGFPGGIA